MSLNQWADLHGEDGGRVVMRPPNYSKHAKWCDLCQCWVERSDAKHWSPDGSFTHYLCPGCDGELWQPENNEDDPAAQQSVQRIGGTCLHKNVDPDVCVCLDCGEDRPVPSNR